MKIIINVCILLVRHSCTRVITVINRDPLIIYKYESIGHLGYSSAEIDSSRCWAPATNDNLIVPLHGVVGTYVYLMPIRRSPQKGHSLHKPYDMKPPSLSNSRLRISIPVMYKWFALSVGRSNRMEKHTARGANVPAMRSLGIYLHGIFSMGARRGVQDSSEPRSPK